MWKPKEKSKSKELGSPSKAEECVASGFGDWAEQADDDEKRWTNCLKVNFYKCKGD